MRLIQFATVLTILAAPSVANALAYSVVGNAPQSPANYKTWTGLAEFVNQPTRRHLFWCNGADSFSYTGDTADLNAALKLFAKIDCRTHTVVLRPGPSQGKYDWQLHIVQGIVRHYVQQNDMKLVRDLEPTLVVYISEKLDINSVHIPVNVQLQQVADLRSRYVRAVQVGTDATKAEAAMHLKAIDDDPVKSDVGTADYNVQSARITAFIDAQAKAE